MSYPKTAAEWWALCDERLDDLRGLVASFHPRANCVVPFDMPITAVGAELACQLIRKVITVAEAGQPDPVTEFMEAVKARDRKVRLILSATWFGIPESMTAHDLPSFGALCDLCSESGVLYEDEVDASELGE